MNIKSLEGPLEVSENPGLETIDPRFSDIASLVLEGGYEEAAARSEEILQEKIYDIRIIGYFLYGHFLDQGVGAMADIYRCLVGLLCDNLEALGPARKREMHIQTILTWLFKQLLKKMQYEEEKKSGLWEAWTAGVSSDHVQDALDAGDKLRRALGPVLEDAAGPVLDALTKVNDWLAAFQRVVYRKPEPGPEEAEEEKGRPSATPWADEEGISIEGSYHLKLLISKMQAFERLIEMERFDRAAIVADDINRIIANFDPRLYFPEMFSKYSLLFALNIGELTPFGEYKGSVEWKAMQDLYKVDPDSFVSTDAQVSYSSSPAEQGDQGEEED